MSNFEQLHEELRGDRKTDEAIPESIDRDALATLVEEFGGLAGWKCKNDTGRWSREGWDELIIRLYHNRHLLDGIEDSKVRGKAALDAMSTRPTSELDRLIALLATES